MDHKLLHDLTALLPSDAEVVGMRAHAARDPGGFRKLVSKTRRALAKAGVPPKHVERLLYCYGFLDKKPD